MLLAAGAARLLAASTGGGCDCARDGCASRAAGVSCPVARAHGGRCPAGGAAGERLSSRCGCRHESPAIAAAFGHDPARLAAGAPALEPPERRSLAEPPVLASPILDALPPEPPPPRRAAARA